MLTDPAYIAVKGKTYSLFGNSQNTFGYYSYIRNVLGRILEEEQDAHNLLKKIRKTSGRKVWLVDALSGKTDATFFQRVYLHLGEQVSHYTYDVGSHLEGVSRFTSKKSALKTTELQYHLYMLEIELTNRLNKEVFLRKSYRFALLPHCLRDIWVSCNAEFTDIDYQCRHCNKSCFLNHISRILEKNNIKPYIWTNRNLKKIFRRIASSHPDFGVLGIACIPELVAGMRRSTKQGIPAVGVPLNANCCARWFGNYRENSVDLDELVDLIS